MSDTKRYESEHELSFEIPLVDFLKLLADGTLSKKEVIRIQQKWLFKGKADGCMYSTRIRSTQKCRGTVGTTPDKFEPWGPMVGLWDKYEYTTKYYLSQTERLEFNAPISHDEYEKISSLHPNGKVVNKTRILFRDKTVDQNFGNILYSADIVKGGDKVIIELEFSSKEAKALYAPPSWAKPYFKEET